MALKDKDVAAAFNADLPPIQFPTDFPAEIHETIDTIAAQQCETAEAVAQLQKSLRESTTSINERISAIVKAMDKCFTNLGNATIRSHQALSQAVLALQPKPILAKPWYRKPWLWSAILAAVTLLIYVVLIGYHTRDFDTATLAPIEQIVASDDYADYLAHCKARREMPEESLKALGLKPLPKPAVETPPIVAQRQSLAALHNWHTHLSHLHHNLLILLVLSVIAPPLITSWCNLFPTKK
ncbi:MAG: hypothetical protein LIP02_02745 [Bacteroidales bacterium]|nr:hypothetical protein [Bacteroidales bacterium]